jgi:hypothetical protein
MDAELLYSYVMTASRFFLGSWAVLLVLACVVEFRHD